MILRVDLHLPDADLDTWLLRARLRGAPDRDRLPWAVQRLLTKLRGTVLDAEILRGETRRPVAREPRRANC